MSRVLRLAPLLLGAGLLALLAWSFGLAGIAGAVANLSGGNLLLYLGLSGVVLLGYALRWQFVARSLGASIPLSRLASARLAGDAVGTIVPSARLAGDPVRVAIVCAGGAEGTTASAGVALDRVIETIANTICALVYISVFSLSRTAGGEDGGMMVLAGPLALGLGALGIPLLMLRLGVRPLWPLYALALARGRRSPWLDAARRTEDHLTALLRRRPAVVLWGVLLSLATEAVVVAQYHFLLSAFGVVADLPTLLLVLVGTGMARALPTPASLGTLEGGQVAVFTLAEGAPALGFVAGMVIRLHETLFLVAGLVSLSAHGLSLSRLSLASPSEGVSA